MSECASTSLARDGDDRKTQFFKVVAKVSEACAEPTSAPDPQLMVQLRHVSDGVRGIVGQGAVDSTCKACVARLAQVVGARATENMCAETRYKALRRL